MRSSSSSSALQSFSHRPTPTGALFAKTWGRLGQAIKANAGRSIVDKIEGHLQREPQLQAILLQMLENRTLDAETAKEQEDAKEVVPPSCNKYRLVDWRILRDGLCIALPQLEG